jgi:integrase
MSLSDTACKNAHKNAKASTGKAFTLFDDKGLHLLVKPISTGWAKYWRLKYRYNSKDALMSLGVYPETSLQQARVKRDDARRLLADGINPIEHKRLIGSAALDTFEQIATQWGDKKSSDWHKPHSRSRHMLTAFIFPYMGNAPINDIKPVQVLSYLRKIEDRGTIETAHRTLNIVGQVYRYAVASGLADRDITQDLKGALMKREGGHFAAITEPNEVKPLMQAIRGYDGSFIVKSALQLAPLVFVRPGELRAAKWQDIDLAKAEWRYIVGKTKTPHIVPLSTQAIEIIKAIQPLTGHGVWMFPSERNQHNTLAGRCMSNNSLNAALRRLGYSKEQMAAHGFRAMARTILDEVLGFRPDFIEHQLAHAVRDPNGRAYNRTAHLPERKRMMQAWSDYLMDVPA